ncbi:very short patch repair endonuclease [Leifsonia sp. Root112D2]|uniref:very short patch repair endonuclease n=1 Tax=Leifsonia sp. Root112D2 TaxID=1736426 RepID=UPI0009EC232F|nr:very short patch repair endonuclease [Leifsonia sp. Root112D2]
MGESWASSDATRRSMRSNRGSNTQPELAVRRLLHASGLRFRVNCRPIPDLRRTADIVFTRAKVAVFIDGCFWHGCPDHYQRPASHRDYWDLKVVQNRERDAETDTRLTTAGWRVIRHWEHEDPRAVADEVEACWRLAVHGGSKAG